MSRYLRVIVLVIILLTAFAGTVSAYNATDNESNLKIEVKVTDRGKTTVYKTSKETIGDFFAENGISLGEYDSIAFPLTDSVRSRADAKEITISRGFVVFAEIGENSKGVPVKGGSTVETLINVLKEETGKEYSYSGNIYKMLEPGDMIELSEITETFAVETVNEAVTYAADIEEEVVTLTEVVPFETEIRTTFDLSSGEEKVLQNGVNGEKESTFKVTKAGGVEQAKELVKENVTKKPVKKIVEYGIAGVLEADLSKLSIAQTHTMNSTAYSAGYKSTGKNPGDHGYGVTASGAYVRPGIVAVDPRVIPLGTKLYVEGYGYAVAADTGGAIKGNKIDLYYESEEAADRYGRKNITVYVLNE